MSDDWDTVTKIGSRVNGGGGQRETVVRGKSALNAAKRAGTVVGTEKKVSTGNKATKTPADAQFNAKVDNADTLVARKTVGKDVGQLIQLKRQEEGKQKFSRVQLADKFSIPHDKMQEMESGTLPSSEAEKWLPKIENLFNVKLRGKDIGAPKFGPKK